MKPGKLQTNKQRSQDLCWKVQDRVHIFRFVLTYFGCIIVVTFTFLLVSSSGTNHDVLCFVHGHGQKSEEKHRTENFAKFLNHLPLLTMIWAMRSFIRQCQLKDVRIF